MANRALVVTAKVRDASSASLKKIKDSLKDSGGQAKQTAVNFSEFNRVMFATSAYLGLFTKAFSKFGDALFQGAQFDRVVGQFERVLGPKGDLFSAIAGFTDNSIDKVEALRSAIQLKTLGIAKNTGDAAELIARAGTAGKLAGMDSAEGIKHFTAFLKDGSVANLEFLNLIRSSDPALKLQMAMIGKMGGVLGGALTAQMKYNMGLRLLRMATEGAMKGQRDLYDVVFDLKQAFKLLKNEIGIFLGTAISSVMDKVTRAADKLSSLLEYIRTTKKEVLFLAKAFVVMGGALAAIAATFGTLRLVGIGLRALGLSATPLIFAVLTLTTVFGALTYKVKEGVTPVERFVEKIRVFGAVLKGVWQLVNSYLTSQDNMRKGIGLIDRDLYELLNKNGLFVFVQNTSKVLATLAKFGIAVFKQLVTWAKELDDIFGHLSNKFSEIFGVNKKLSVDLDATGNVIDEPHIKRLSARWLDANTRSGAILKKAAAAILVAFTAYKAFGIGKGFLSHIPLLGRLFKTGGGNKPDGTKSNPVHVVVDNQGKSSLAQKARAAFVAADMGAFGSIGKYVTNFISSLLTMTASMRNLGFAGILRQGFARVWLSLASQLLPLRGVLTAVAESFSGLSKVSVALRGFQIIHILLAAFGLLTGVIQGVVENFSSFTGLFGAAYDYLKSVDYAQMFSDLYNSISATFSDIGQFISDTFSSVYDIVSNAISSAMAPLRDFGNYLYAKLAEGFGIIAPYIQAVLAPIGAAFETFKGWVSTASEALKAFYEKLINIPVVGELVKAAVSSMVNPFGTFKSFGQEGVGALAAGADMFSSSIKNATAKNFLDQSQSKGTLPFMPATSDERSDYAMRAIEQASGLDRDRMARAYREAQEGTSAGGKEITADEFARIFGIALDNSKIAKHTKETAIETKNNNPQKAMASRRGGC
jgi:hypothetical protein